MKTKTPQVVSKAIGIYGYEKLAEKLGVSSRTIRRWEAGETGMSRSESLILQQIALQFEAKHRSPRYFTFVDLFAGIGGLRLGVEKLGGECIFVAEPDEYCRKTYLANFPVSDGMIGDIRGLVGKARATIQGTPDLLLACLPCQSFSPGSSVKDEVSVRASGSESKERINPFFEVASVIEELRPRAFLLETTRNFERHDDGNTHAVVMNVLTRDLGYSVSYKVLDAKGFVPQRRERTYIVGFDCETGFVWDELRLSCLNPMTLKHILEPDSKVDDKYVLSDKFWTYLQNNSGECVAARNHPCPGLVGGNELTPSLSARYHKDGSEILVDRGKRKNPRRLTPRECARLMGFPDSFVIPVSDTRAYQQFGRSAVVPVAREVAEIMIPHILELKYRSGGNLQVNLCSYPNSDYGQTARQSPSQKVWVPSLKEASAVCRKYIEYWNLGGGNWGPDSGNVMKQGVLVANVSYNGRIWPVKEEGTSSAPTVQSPV